MPEIAFGVKSGDLRHADVQRGPPRCRVFPTPGGFGIDLVRTARACRCRDGRRDGRLCRWSSCGGCRSHRIEPRPRPARRKRRHRRRYRDEHGPCRDGLRIDRLRVHGLCVHGLCIHGLRVTRYLLIRGLLIDRLLLIRGLLIRGLRILRRIDRRCIGELRRCRIFSAERHGDDGSCFGCIRIRSLHLIERSRPRDRSMKRLRGDRYEEVARTYAATMDLADIARANR